MDTLIDLPMRFAESVVWIAIAAIMGAGLAIYIVLDVFKNVRRFRNTGMTAMWIVSAPVLTGGIWFMVPMMFGLLIMPLMMPLFPSFYEKMGAMDWFLVAVAVMFWGAVLLNLRDFVRDMFRLALKSSSQPQTPGDDLI